MRTLILAAFTRCAPAALAVILAGPATAGGCDYYCRKNGGTATTAPAPSTAWTVTNTSRQRLGDVYNPGHGRRVQIRDPSRRIIGYIEADGSITNTSRQVIGTIEESQ